MRLSILLLAVAVPLVANAGGKMKPGLWEMSMKSDAAREMPKMTPEQLEKLKKMGINLPVMKDGAVVHRVCMTQEMVDRDHTPGMQTEHECKMASHDQSGDSYSVKLHCDGPNLKGDGTIKGTISDGKRINSTYDFAGTSHGRDVKHHTETSGQWISADCGDVKPIGDMMMKKKPQ